MNRNQHDPLRYASRRTRLNVALGLLLFGLGAIFGAVAGIFIFLQITGGNAAVSEPISAPTLSVAEFQNSNQESVAELAETVVIELVTPTAEPTEAIATQPVPTAVPTETAVSAEPTVTPLPPPSPTPTIPPTATPQLPQLFRIDSSRSQARFSVYETFPEGWAVGGTNQIAGDVIIDFTNPPNSQVGTIRINLRSLQTDDTRRDQSIRCCVLLSGRDEYEFGEFRPTVISGLPTEVAFGQAIPVQISGELTVRGATNPVTFDSTLNLSSETELSGLATAQINRADFGILNNDENGFDYHGVAAEVTLEFEFVAVAVEEQ